MFVQFNIKVVTNTLNQNNEHQDHQKKLKLINKLSIVKKVRFLYYHLLMMSMDSPIKSASDEG